MSERIMKVRFLKFERFVKSIRFNVHIQIIVIAHACHGHTLQLSFGMSV